MTLYAQAIEYNGRTRPAWLRRLTDEQLRQLRAEAEQVAPLPGGTVYPLKFELDREDDRRRAA